MLYKVGNFEMNSKKYSITQALLLCAVLALFVAQLANTQAGQASRSAAGAGSVSYLPFINNQGPDGGDAFLAAAGDIAKCGFPGDSQTAALIEGLPGTVLALGDNAYDSGTAAEYANCYAPTWGAFFSRTKPIPGNHDYLTPNASGYFGYFGALAGDPAKGYYSYNLGSWHILAINSNCSQVGGCKQNNPQELWVRADLAKNQAQCVLAYWHHPMYSSGQTGDNPQMAVIWQDLYNAHAEIVLSGHDHDYERFLPQDANAALDNGRGVVQFVVGTGGGNFTPIIQPIQPNSAVTVEHTYGVLQLTLHTNSYDWAFIAVDGRTLDSGTANCR